MIRSIHKNNTHEPQEVGELDPMPGNLGVELPDAAPRVDDDVQGGGGQVGHGGPQVRRRRPLHHRPGTENCQPKAPTPGVNGKLYLPVEEGEEGGDLSLVAPGMNDLWPDPLMSSLSEIIMIAVGRCRDRQ